MKQVVTELLDNTFVNYGFGKKPMQLDLPAGFLICEEMELVKALKRYTEIPNILKINNKLAEFVTGINNLKTSMPINSFAISHSDLSLDDYLNRINTLNQDQEWSIAYFGLHGASEYIWDNAKLFIDVLSDAIGFRPGGRADVDCFIGRYSSTPSGIHVDDAHNFGFTFRNGKTMYTWNNSNKHLLWLKSPNYDAYKQDAIALENTVNCVCYFPHDYLHVAETKEQISVNLNISLWNSIDEAQESIDYLCSKLAGNPIFENPGSFSGRARISKQVMTNFQCLTDMVMDGTYEKQLVLNHLLIQTTSGMKVPRPIFDTKLCTMESNFTCRPFASVQWYKLSNDELAIGANGHCVSCTYDPDVESFLHEVITGLHFNVRKFNQHKQSKIYDLINFLYRSGAIETCN